MTSDARTFLEGLIKRIDAVDGTARPIPEATPPRGHHRMCVGMATFDDFEGVWFTIQAIRMYHPEVADRLAFLILDNHPEGPAAFDLKALENWIPSLRYVPFRGYRGTSVRDLVFREADADIVCCVDSHVLLQPGALAAIERWFDADPDSRDLIQGPLISDALDGPMATQFDPEWGSGMYGQWGLDPRVLEPDAKPFEIGMQGLGVFACRREAWPGINPRFRGFGGEEGYLHEKVRQAGGRAVCHPAVGWAHRFSRPAGPPYGALAQDALRNYLIGWQEMNWDIAAVEAHFRQHYGRQADALHVEQMLERAARETASPFSFFDGIFCLNLDAATGRWSDVSRRLARLDIAWQVERFPAVATPENHHRGCAISFRRMIAEARRRDYKHVLILEDDALFIDDAASVMRAAADDLSELEWDLCFLGACVHGKSFDFLLGSDVLQECGPVTCTHAVAVHRRAYDQILADMPAADDEFERWLAEWIASDQYLYRRIEDGTFRAVITSPRIASQPFLLNYGDGDLELAERYVI